MPFKFHQQKQRDNETKILLQKSSRKKTAEKCYDSYSVSKKSMLEENFRSYNVHIINIGICFQSATQ